MEYYQKIIILFLFILFAVIVYFLVNQLFLKKKVKEFLDQKIIKEDKSPTILNDLKEEPSEFFDGDDWENDTDFNIEKHEIKDPYRKKTLDEIFKENSDNQSLDDEIKNLLK